MKGPRGCFFSTWRDSEVVRLSSSSGSGGHRLRRAARNKNQNQGSGKMGDTLLTSLVDSEPKISSIVHSSHAATSMPFFSKTRPSRDLGCQHSEPIFRTNESQIRSDCGVTGGIIADIAQLQQHSASKN
jgi:hypothetical protein